MLLRTLSATALAALVSSACSSKSNLGGEDAGGGRAPNGAAGDDSSRSGSSGESGHSAAGGSQTDPANDGSAGSATSEPEPLQVLVEGEQEPWALAIDDRYVYWTADDRLRRAPLAGGEASTLASGQALRHVAAAFGYAFFTDALADTVSRVHRDGGNVEVLGTGSYPEGIAVGPNAVYWTNQGWTVGEPADGTLATAALDGSHSAILIDNLQQPSGVAVDDQFVYFTSTSRTCGASSEGNSGCYGGGVSKVPIAGGAPVVVDAEGTPFDVVVGERGIYWMATPGPRVMFAPLDGGSAEVLADVLGESEGPIALDAEAFYFNSTSDGRVMRVPLDGGEAEPVVVDLGTTGGIAVDATWVYVAATSQGRILRVAKDGSASRPSGPITGPCPTPIGAAAQIALTPRADQNLELLALTLDEGELVASQDTYDRLVADVAAIRKLVPALADVDYFEPHDGKSLLLFFSDLTLQSIDAEQYSAWDCLNDFYGLESIQVLHFTLGPSHVLLTLKGLYNLDLLAEVYSQLPGIESAEANSYDGDGPTICVLRDGSRYEYVVDRAGGDCPAGCTTHQARHFESSAAGVIETLEVWDSEADESQPGWFSRVCGS